MLPMIPNNALDAGIQPRQLFMELPMQGEGLDQAAVQLDQNMQEVQVRLFQVVFEVGLKMGEAIQTLRLERLQLESENRSLENDITQLKAIHISELNGAVDGFIAKRNIIADMVRAVVEKLTVFCKTYPNAGVSSSDANLLKVIVDAPVNYEGLRGNHEYLDYRQNRIPLQEQTALVPLSEALVLRQNYPMIRSLTQRPMDDYEGLRSEIAPIRAVNLALTDKKSIMIDYHDRFIAELHRQEREFRLKEILKTVNLVYGLLKNKETSLETTQKEFFDTREQIWNLRQSMGAGCHDMRFDAFIPLRYPHFSGLQTKYSTLSQKVQPQECIEKLKEISVLMQGVVSTLEKYVNPQEIRRPT